MAEEKLEQRSPTWRQLLPWTVLFRGFQVARDPKKLLLAAAGIVVMAAGWWLLAVIFFNSRSRPAPSEVDSLTTSYQQEGLPLEQARNRAQDDFEVARQKFELLEHTAGPGDPAVGKPVGTLRVMPWSEDRGPNPFTMINMLVTGQASTSDPGFWGGVVKQMRYLVEPLVKLISPVVYLLYPEAGFWNRVYFLLVILWTLATWAVFGAAITRIAVVQVARGEKIGLTEALRFVLRHYLSFFSAPLFPLAVVTVLLVVGFVLGLFSWIPLIGDVANMVLWPIGLAIGLGIALVLLGLVGWPLMYATISAEGSDAFDGISRSYNYVFQSPWSFLGYSAVSLAYGMVLVFFVGLMGSMAVYLGKWGLSQGALTQSRDPSYLYVYAPTSFHWRELLLQGAVVDGNRVVGADGTIDPAAYASYLNTFRWYNQVGAAVVTFWLGLFFLMVLGFSYSYFWSACSIIYLLMRRQVDDTDLDEVYLEEEEEEGYGAAEPGGATVTATTAAAPVSMVEPPALRQAAPPPAPTPPPAPVIVSSTAVENSGRRDDGDATTGGAKAT